MSQCGHFCGTRVTADSVTLAYHTFVAPQWSDQASGSSGGSSLVNDTGGPDRSEPSFLGREQVCMHFCINSSFSMSDRRAPVGASQKIISIAKYKLSKLSNYSFCTDFESEQKEKEGSEHAFIASWKLKRKDNY